MSKSRPRVAMIGYTFYASDARLIRHTRNLVNAGFDVDVIALREPGKNGPRDEPHVRFFGIQDRNYARRGASQFIFDYGMFTVRTFLQLLRNRMRGRSYTVAHVNNMPNFILFGVLPFRLFGLPIVLDVHDTMPELYMERAGVPESHWMVRILRLEERVCLRLANFVVTTEHTKRDRLLENGLSDKKNLVLMNLADPEVFPANPIENSDRKPDDAFRVVYHGTLARRLGVDLAVRAIAAVKHRVPRVRFEITGDGEQRPELLALAKELGVEDVIQFSDGFVPTGELPARLRGADLAVLPSRKNVATDLMLPVKLLEYVRLGIPAIVVGTRTIQHYFRDDMVYTVPANDPEAIAEAIVSLYENPEARVDLARRARFFYEEYNYEEQYAEYVSLIRSLCGNPQPLREEDS